VKPRGDKTMRLRSQTAAIEAGLVRLPAEAPWLADYLTELMAFPRARHDDQADSTAQALDWIFHPAGRAEGFLEMIREELAKGAAGGG
jgi:predicted phage terminase large subunit-like protein